MTETTHHRRRWAARLAAVAAVTVSGIGATAAAALAHISVTPSTAQTGSTTELTLRVPNEAARASTTRVTVQIPTEHPIAQLLAKPVPGWTVSVKTSRLATPLVTDDGTFHSVVSQVTWQGGRIHPGQYQDFSLSADPLPDQPTTLIFKALQGYSDGTLVRWIDVPQTGQPEPEHPAPVLTVTTSSGGGAEPSPASAAPDVTDVTDNGASTGSDDSSGKGVAWIALVVAVLAAALGGASLVASRRRR